jgi:hypothetical protein
MMQTIIILKIKENSKYWKGMQRKKGPCTLLTGMETGAATVGNNPAFPQKQSL